MLDATVTSKGQITIPAHIRAQMGIKPGDQIHFTPLENGDFTIRRKKRYTLDDLMKILPKSKIKLTDAQIREARAQAAVARYERALHKRAKGKKK